MMVFDTNGKDINAKDFDLKELRLIVLKKEKQRLLNELADVERLLNDNDDAIGIDDMLCLFETYYKKGEL